MSRIAHLVIGEDGETVWMAGGPYGVITLHSMNGRPIAICAHAPREMPGWEKTPTCMRLEGMPCWYLNGSSDDQLYEILSGLTGGKMSEQALWSVLDTSYMLYLASAR